MKLIFSVMWNIDRLFYIEHALTQPKALRGRHKKGLALSQT